MCNLHTNVSGRSTDPTRTKTLRREYEKALAQRWRKVIRAIMKEVVKKNGFGIKTNARFEFGSNQDKVQAFQSWMSDQINKHLFDGDLTKSFDDAAKRFWGNSFANIAYRRGLLKSVSDIKRAGGGVADEYIDSAMKRGAHAETLEKLYSRQFEDLKNISEKMSTQISETLAEGLAEGKGPFSIARDIADRVEKVGITRSRLLARTEIIHAYAESQLNTFVDANIQGVNLEPELMTAGDGRVCEECEAAAREAYTVASARGVLPIHPNCRCAWAPVIENGKEIRLS